MKKGQLILGIILTGVFLSGCSYMTPPEKSETKVSSQEITALTENTEACFECGTTTTGTKESQEVADITTIFTATIKEDLIKETDFYRLILTDPEIVEDPENILASIKAGVILNLAEDLVQKSGPEKLTAGTHVQVTLKGLPIMTMSLPPQIPGRSIVEVSVID